MVSMQVLDLFSGIGGFSIGLENIGWETVAFCEKDKHCQAVLKKHWPETMIFNDIVQLTKNILPSDIDVICGGFPCQDISCAGKGEGITGSRSNLWKEYKRLINEVKPKYAIIENVANLRSKGLVSVLQDLLEIGYDAEWHCIPACAFGAPHRRDRIWIIAYPSCFGERGLSIGEKAAKPTPRDLYQDASDTDCMRCNCGQCDRQGRYLQNESQWQCPQVHKERNVRESRACKAREVTADTDCKGLQRLRELGEISTILSQEQVRSYNSLRGITWGAEQVARLVDDRLNPEFVEWMMGFPIGWTDNVSRTQRIKGLGNSLVPIIPEMIADAISKKFNSLNAIIRGQYERVSSKSNNAI